MGRYKKYKEVTNEFNEKEIVEDNENKEIVEDNENKEGKIENIILKDITINVGRVYYLKKGDTLPTEIDKKFFSSFKTERII